MLLHDCIYLFIFQKATLVELMSATQASVLGPGHAGLYNGLFQTKMITFQWNLLTQSCISLIADISRMDKIETLQRTATYKYSLG